MPDRTIEDRLREEYFDLLPEIRRVVHHLETVAKYRLLAVVGALNRFEQLVIKARVKECESSIEALRRRQEGATFDRERADSYSLRNLKDLAGVRVLVFPRRRMEEIDAAFREVFKGWTEDPVLGADGERLALKYYGFCPASERIMCEYQIVPLLTGLFWEVEHSAIYKPSPELRGSIRSLEMAEPIAEVQKALSRFEREFELLVRRSSEIVQS